MTTIDLSSNNFSPMFATSSDVLNISLAGGFILLVIFACMALFYLTLILRDVSKMSDDAKSIVDRVHAAIIEPLKLVDFLVEKIKPYLEAVIEKRMKGKDKSSK